MSETKVVKLPLSIQQAAQILQQVADDTRRLIITYHADERMRERGITRTDVIRVLSTGRIVEGPGQSAKGNWEMRVEGISAGSYVTLGVAIDYTVLEEQDCVAIIITTF